MPRRSLLTFAERAGLLAFPTTDDELIRYYTFSEPNLSAIRQRRGNHNRLGFAVQLCYLRYPGFALPIDAEPPAPLLSIVGRKLNIEPDVWPQYAQRPATRREDLAELLGFRFAPRIRDLADKRLSIYGDAKSYRTLAGLIGGSVNVKRIRRHWDDVLRLAASIRQGSVSASLMLRKLGSYPRQNDLAVALRELGRIERTLFALDWMQSVELRRRVQVGLNKGEAKNALARAIFLNRLGEIRNRSFENQRYRASGLDLAVAAITLWNTVYLDRAIQSLRDSGQPIDEELLPHISPLGWEHIILTGDYIWQQNKLVEQGKFRPLRMLNEA
jgi:TnpA family transposase